MNRFMTVAAIVLSFLWLTACSAKTPSPSGDTENAGGLGSPSPKESSQSSSVKNPQLQHMLDVPRKSNEYYQKLNESIQDQKEESEQKQEQLTDELIQQTVDEGKMEDKQSREMNEKSDKKSQTNTKGKQKQDKEK